MAQIYGELIRAQLQIAAEDVDVGAAVTGLVYFNSSTGLKWHTGSGWKTAVDLDSTQSLSGKTLDSSCDVDVGSLPIVSLAKGGLGTDGTLLSGLVRIDGVTTTAGQITVDDIPDTTVLYSKLDLADGDIPQAKVLDLVADLGDKVEKNADIAPATKAKITYDAKGLVTSGDDLISDDIPSTLLEKIISSTSEITGALILPVGTTAEQPSPSVQGMVRYNTTDATFEGYDGTEWGAIGGGGGGGTLDVINQVGHALAVGDVVYLNGSTYTKAIASAANTAEVVGVVSKVNTVDQFELTLSGEVSGLTGLVAGEVYFLSATTAGALTVTEPTVVGHISLPVGVASSNTTLYVAPKRGIVVGATNARTQIPLGGSTSTSVTTTVQNVAAYEAGELSGWVAISATTPLKFYVNAQFSKNGAGNNYNLSYQTSGDTPPVGFLLQVTAAGLIQAVLPAIAGFGSASITYGLDVAAIGTNFPLSVSARSVLGDTSGTEVPSGYVGETRSKKPVSNVSLGGNNIATNVTSISLNPGVYMLTGMVRLNISSGTATSRFFGISTSASTLGSITLGEVMSISGNSYNPAATIFVNIVSQTTYYLNAQIGFSVAPVGNYGTDSVIQAVRIA